jgi:hypothetical protein
MDPRAVLLQTLREGPTDECQLCSRGSVGHRVAIGQRQYFLRTTMVLLFVFCLRFLSGIFIGEWHVVWLGLVWFWLIWSGLVWSGLVWFGGLFFNASLSLVSQP